MDSVDTGFLDDRDGSSGVDAVWDAGYPKSNQMPNGFCGYWMPGG